MRLEDMTEPQLRDTMQSVGAAVKNALPPNTGFIVLAASFEAEGERSSLAQYVSNVRKQDAAKWMLETIERWALGDYIPRQGD